jgi:DNA end-binding protein Ku
MPRPIWKGSITFGLVNIPVQLEVAVREKSVSFHMVSKDGTCRLRRKLYCPETGKEFDFGDTARGVEIGKGEFALVDEKEIDALRPAQGRAIEIVQFVKLTDIDPLYFDRPYFVVPTEASLKSYRLLHEAMAQSKRIALAQFVMRDREYLSAIRVLGDGMVLHTMHYTDEVLSLDDALPGGVVRAKPNPKETQIANQLIDAMTHPLDLTQFKDEYREQLEKLIETKKSGKTLEVPDEVNGKELPHTTNLMEALRRSLAGNVRKSTNGNGHGRHSARKPPHTRRQPYRAGKN